MALVNQNQNKANAPKLMADTINPWAWRMWLSRRATGSWHTAAKATLAGKQNAQGSL